MCTMLYTSIFLLVLGPFIKHMHAEDATILHQTQPVTENSFITSTGNTAPTDDGDNSISTSENPLGNIMTSAIQNTIGTPMMSASPGNDVSTSQNPTGTPKMSENPTTGIPTTEVPVTSETEKTTLYDSGVAGTSFTISPDLKATSKDTSETTGSDQELSITQSSNKTAMLETTTVISTQPSTASKVIILMSTARTEQEKTTRLQQNQLPSSTPARITTADISTSTYHSEPPSKHIETTAETTQYSTTTQEQAGGALTTESTNYMNISNTADENSSLADTTGGGEKDNKIIIIGIIVFFIICFLVILCVTIIVKQKRKSGKQHFGHTNSRSKKKKNIEDDVWAGPVKLGGGDKADGVGGEDEPLQDEEKKAEGPDVKLSTFTAPEENGGVGQPGSKEVQKWEEKEPLLFIDETNNEEKDKETKKEKGEGGGDNGNDNSDVNGPKQNGDTFCITTAV